MKILILAANPRKDLNLDREIRDLKEVIQKSRKQQEFQVEDALAVRVGDLQELLLQHRPQIVHFCGHGSGRQGLVFEGNEGGEQWVRTEAIAGLFRLVAAHVGCVLLNACYSEEQAKAIVDHIDYVIGMNQAIQDQAAIAFAKGFYRALGYECSIEQAFEFGKNAIQLEISGSSQVRSAVTEETEKTRKAIVLNTIEQTAIPEHLKPILKIRPALLSGSQAKLTTDDRSLSQETRATIQVEIDRSLEKNAVEQFRDKVREYLSDRKLSPIETIRLEQLRRRLGLSETVAKQIEDEEWEPIRQAQDEYQEILNGLIEAGQYPLDAITRTELSVVRHELGLNDDEVTAIETPILALAEQEYQEAQRREQQRKLEQQQRLSDDLGNGVTLELVSIAGGSFWMGQTDVEQQRLIKEVGEENYQKWYSHELPRHQVTVQPFLMGKFAVTQAQWRAVAGLPKIEQDLALDPSNFKGKNRPVEQVSWQDAIEFCQRLSQKTGRQYRLPSEAEWEYACRAGTTTPFYCGETIATDLANYHGNYIYGSGVKGVYREQTTEVGSFSPNAFGLYDMHGNVWEWCADRWHETYQGAPTDGSAWVTGEDDCRLLRGGSWNNHPGICRSANRNWSDSGIRYGNLGFRVVSSAAWTS